MKTVKIKFDSIEAASDFVKIVAQFKTNFDLMTERRVIDGKSILGILSLDLSQVLDLQIEEETDEIMDAIAPYVASKEASEKRA